MEDINNKSIPKKLMIFIWILGALVVIILIYNSPIGDFLANKPTLVEMESEKGPDGQPIIFWRITQEDRKEVTRMLDLGYDIETKGGFDATPVIDAALIDDWTMVLFLLERGANPLIADRRGITLANLADSSRVDLNGRYGLALVKVRTFLEKHNADTVYEIQEVKEMVKAGEWPPVTSE